MIAALLALLAAFTISWDASPDATVVGYKVRYGTAPGNYTTTLAVGTATRAVIANPPDGVAFFAVVTAHTKDGIESLPSAEVAWPTTTLVFHQLPVAQQWSVWEINAGEISGSLGLWRASTEKPKILSEPWAGIGPSAYVRWEFTVPLDRPLRFFKLHPIP